MKIGHVCLIESLADERRAANTTDVFGIATKVTHPLFNWNQ